MGGGLGCVGLAKLRGAAMRASRLVELRDALPTDFGLLGLQETLGFDSATLEKNGGLAVSFRTSGVILNSGFAPNGLNQKQVSV